MPDLPVSEARRRRARREREHRRFSRTDSDLGLPDTGEELRFSDTDDDTRVFGPDAHVRSSDAGGRTRLSEDAEALGERDERARAAELRRLRAEVARRRRARRRARRRRRALLALVVVAGLTVFFAGGSGGSRPGALAAASGSTSPQGAGRHQPRPGTSDSRGGTPRATSSSGDGSGAGRTGGAAASGGPLHVLGIAEAPVPDGDPGDIGPIVVHLSEAPEAGEHPTIDPALPGTWSHPAPTLLEFTPASGTVTTSPEVVTVPAGMESEGGGRLASSVSARFTPTAGGAVLRLQELLAELGYLPLRFTPTTPVGDTDAAQLAALDSPPAGRFRWAFPDVPPSLAALWAPGAYAAMTEGAVMDLESTEGLPVDDSYGEGVLSLAVEARLDGRTDPKPYSYIHVSENRPETLTLYLNGRKVLTSLANTGIDDATPIGTWPVYLRNAVQTLVGTYPNGVPYDIPGVRDINYFDGNDAVHAFVRAHYGFPQSAGCVELPPAAAAVVWNDIGYGTLVTVAAPTGTPT